MGDGFDALYREHRAALTRYARRQVGDSADDIVAATFEIAYTRLRSSHPHPLGWLFRTARNLIAAQRGRDERERIAGRDAALIAAPQDEVSDIEVIRLTSRRGALAPSFPTRIDRQHEGRAVGCPSWPASTSPILAPSALVDRDMVRSSRVRIAPDGSVPA